MDQSREQRQKGLQVKYEGIKPGGLNMSRNKLLVKKEVSQQRGYSPPETSTVMSADIAMKQTKWCKGNTKVLRGNMHRNKLKGKNESNHHY